MKHGLFTAAVAFCLVAGSTFAQTTSETTTTTTSPLPAPLVAPEPPAGVVSTTQTDRSVDANGNEVDTTRTTYGTAIAPPPAETVTTTKKIITTTSSGD
jgi:hypothetical protein